MARVKNDIDNLMKEYGFTLVRKKNHRIYQNKDGVKITTSNTASDGYYLNQIRRTVRKVLANHYGTVK